MSWGPGAIAPERTALLVMDFTNGIVGRLDDPEPTLRAAEQAISWARGGDVQIGFVRVAFTHADYASFPSTSGMGKYVRSVGDFFRDDSETTQIHERVAPRSGDIVVRKTRYGACSTTDSMSNCAGLGSTRWC